MLAVDDLHVGKPRHFAGLEPGARKCSAPAAVERLRVRKVDGAVLREVAVEDDVEQAALADRKYFRHVCERRRQLPVLRNNAHAARPLGHQHASAGQERERPGMNQALGHRLNGEIAG